MSVVKHLQRAWQQQSKWLLLLRPLSVLYTTLFTLHRAYALKFKKPYKAPVPVMVIGNITVGGSGKTPLLIALVRHLQQQGLKVGVISRGYGGSGPFPALVNAQSSPVIVGDEPCLIVQATAAPMVVGANRQASIELLLQQQALDLIISDDGLQHWALARDIEWIVLDLNRGLGNQRLLPEGFLREPVSRLQHATVIEHAAQPRSALSMQLRLGQPYLLFNPLKSSLKPSNFNEASKPSQASTLTASSETTNTVLHDALNSTFDAMRHYHAVVGIGYPERFFQSLRELGIQQFSAHAFADHHTYTLTDVQFNDTLPIITTEKDAVKLKSLWINCDSVPEIWVLPVTAELSAVCYSLLAQQLRAYGLPTAKELS